MNIKIEWCETGRRGYLEYDLDALIKSMPLTNFKKWAKLFGKYGTSKQQETVLSLIKDCFKEEFDFLNLCLEKNDKKAVKRVKDKMHFYNRKYEILLGVIQ